MQDYVWTQWAIKQEFSSLTDGTTETISDSLRFNFETKRGITYQVKLQEGESYIHGEKLKDKKMETLYKYSIVYYL